MKKTFFVSLLLFVGLLFSPAWALDSLSNAEDAILPGYTNNYVLVADTNTTITVPTGAVFVSFSSTANIWVKYGGAASIPTSNVTNGTGCELNPRKRSIEGVPTIGIISPSAAIVSVSFHVR